MVDGNKKKGGDIARAAIALTIVCAITGVGIAWMTANSTGQGAGALWVMFPLVGVVIAHIVLGPAALILALVSRRLSVIAVVFAYFTIGVWALFVWFHGHSPVEVVQKRIAERWARYVDARNFPQETAFCRAFAEELRAGERPQTSILVREQTGSDEFDPDFRCRLGYKQLLPRYLRPEFLRASLIQLAAVSLDPEFVEASIQRDAAIDAPLGDGLTPMLLALSNGHGLSTHGSMAQRPYTARIRATIKPLLRAGANPGVRDRSGAGALHFASGAGDPLLVEQLVEAGVPAFPVTDAGRNAPVHYAIEAVEDLRRRLLNRSLDQAEFDSWFAAQQRIVELLLNHRGDPSAAFSAAVTTSHPWALELLARGGLNVATRIRQNGGDYLRVAMRDSRRAMFDYLVANNADVNQPTSRGEYLIMGYLKPYYKWQLQALIEAGANVEARDRKGRSVLARAVEISAGDAVRQLVAAGAFVTSDILESAPPALVPLLRGDVEGPDFAPDARPAE